ncbi:hypothetical protein AVEN_64627-1 [Araneus ventricosus]|uniref:Uncharacterized protein n=1 Tax=Araneus ventricosus TaxID=182803 RepID=A0A4Y2HDK2_ARAVE|nr:hypothetical protein AVEN_64627-1 [Araneus ventricosus]
MVRFVKLGYLITNKDGCHLSSLVQGGGLITLGESSKFSDMLYSKVSSSDKEEELISASASNFRDFKSFFLMAGEQPYVEVQCQQK